MLNLLTPGWKKDPHKWLEKYGCVEGQDIEACEAGTPFNFTSLDEENQFNQQKHDDIVRNLSGDDISKRVEYYKKLISPTIVKKYRVIKNKMNPIFGNTEKYLYITRGAHLNIYFSDGNYQLAESLPVDNISGSSPFNGNIVGWGVSHSEDKKIGRYTIPDNLKKITLSNLLSTGSYYIGNDNSRYINPIELVIHPGESEELNEELFQNLTLATAMHEVSLFGGGIRKLNKKSKKRKSKKRKSKKRKYTKRRR